MSQIKIHTFPNGFRIVHEPPYNNMQISKIRIYCRIGSAYETKFTRGVSHMIEHMCFKGTRKLPTAKDVSLAFDKIGAYLNATTDKQYTYYTVECSIKDTKHCLCVLADMMLHSTFDRKEYDKEMDVVVEENVKDETDYLDVMTVLLEKMLFQGTPFEYAVDDISYHQKPLSYTATRNMYKQYYTPDNMILSIVSPHAFNKIVDIVSQCDFAKTGIPKFPRLNLFSEIQFPPNDTIQFLIQPKSSIQSTHLGIAFRVPSVFNETHNYMLSVVSSVLSGSFMSRLFSILREENGLTYSSESYLTSYEPTSGFIIRVTTDTDKLLKNGSKPGVIPVLVNMLNDLVKNGVTTKELNHTKGFILGHTLRQVEKSNVQNGYNADQVFVLNRNEVFPYHRVYDTYIKPVKAKEINEIIKQYFTRNNMFVCVYGGNLPAKTTIQRAFANCLHST
jgi:zinc protease